VGYIMRMFVYFHIVHLLDCDGSILDSLEFLKQNDAQRSGICAVGDFIYSSPQATDAERCY